MDRSSVLLLHNQKALLCKEEDQFETVDTKESANYPTGIAVPSSYIDSLTLKFPATMSDEDLSIQIEMKMYKEGGLDVDKEYVVDFIKFEKDDEYIVEAFALEEKDFKNLIEPYKKKLDAVDYAYPRYFIYHYLFTSEKIPKEKNTLFIHVSEQEAYAAVYKDGRFIGQRSLNSLLSLSKRTGFEVVKLKEYLQSKGLVKANYDLDEMHILDAMQEIFLKDIEKVVYSINHKRNLFGLNGIELVFIDFYGGTIEGIDELFLPFGYEVSAKALPLERENQEISMQCGYLRTLVEEIDIPKANLTFLERKKPLKEYESIKFLAIVGVSILLSILASGYFYYQETKLQESISQKKQTLSTLQKKTKVLIKKYKSLKSQNKALMKKKEEFEMTLDVYQTTFDMLPVMNIAKTTRQKFMNDIVETLAKYHLNTRSILQKDYQNMEVVLISKSQNRDTISKFMNDLIAKGYRKVSTDNIWYENGIYTSLVRIQK